MEKLNLSTSAIFNSDEVLKEAYLAQHSDNEIDLSDDLELLKKVYETITNKAMAIDGSLKGFIASEHAKASKGLDNVGKRLKKSEEQKHEVGLKQISALKQKLFPGGGLQERHDNFLNYYINNPDFVNQVIAHVDAFDLRMHVLTD